MIINLTQHPATPEQIAHGVVDMAGAPLATLKALLTFSDLPSAGEIYARASAIAELACNNGLAADGDDPQQPAQAMIGGAGYLLPALEAELLARGIEPLHAFTRREVVESAGTDGAVVKTAVFRHAGWVSTRPYIEMTRSVVLL